MKKLLSVLLIVAMLFGGACADPDSTTLAEQAKSALQGLKLIYDLDKEYLYDRTDLILEFEILFFTVTMMDYTNKDGEFTDTTIVIDGYVTFIADLCQAEQAYAKGEMTVDKYLAKLMRVADVILNVQ